LEVGIFEGVLAEAFVDLAALLEEALAVGEVAELRFVTGEVVVEDGGLADGGGRSEERFAGLGGEPEFVLAVGGLEPEFEFVRPTVAEGFPEGDAAGPLFSRHDQFQSREPEERMVPQFGREVIEFLFGVVVHAELEVADERLEEGFDVAEHGEGELLDGINKIYRIGKGREDRFRTEGEAEDCRDWGKVWTELTGLGSKEGTVARSATATTEAELIFRQAQDDGRGEGELRSDGPVFGGLGGAGGFPPVLGGGVEAHFGADDFLGDFGEAVGGVGAAESVGDVLDLGLDAGVAQKVGDFLVHDDEAVAGFARREEIEQVVFDRDDARDLGDGRQEGDLLFLEIDMFPFERGGLGGAQSGKGAEDDVEENRKRFGILFAVPEDGGESLQFFGIVDGAGDVGVLGRHGVARMEERRRQGEWEVRRIQPL